MTCCCEKCFSKDTPVSAIMHRDPITVSSSMPVAKALDWMREHNIRHLPVKDANTLVGIISDRDINFALRVDGKSPEQLAVRDAYTADPYAVEPNVPLRLVAAEMAERGIGSALIAESGKLVGIVSVVDVCRALSQVLTKL